MKKGHLVTMASMASFIAAPVMLDYCCSKIGALYLSEGKSILSQIDSVPYDACKSSRLFNGN